MLAIGTGVQAFAKNKEPSQEETKNDKAVDGKEKPGPGGPPLRRKVLGERGHGPVVRPNAHGSSQMKP